MYDLLSTARCAWVLVFADICLLICVGAEQPRQEPRENPPAREGFPVRERSPAREGSPARDSASGPPTAENLTAETGTGNPFAAKLPLGPSSLDLPRFLLDFA